MEEYTLLTEQEVAKRIGMSVHWLRRKRWAGGGIPFVKMSPGKGGKVKYREEDVVEFCKKQLRH